MDKNLGGGGYNPPPGTSTISRITFERHKILSRMLCQNVRKWIRYSYLKKFPPRKKFFGPKTEGGDGYNPLPLVARGLKYITIA